MTERLIQVCGDPTVDWLSVQNEEFIISGGVYYWLSDESVPKVRLSSQAGGSALILQLLKKMLPSGARVDGKDLNKRLLSDPKNSPVTSSWTNWRAYIENKEPHFRISEWRQCESGKWDYENNKLHGFPDLLVIEDSGLGFSRQEKGWPEALSEDQVKKRPQHVILKLAQYADGIKNPLVNRLISLGLAPKTTVLTSISDLRACRVKVGVSLSWERLFEDVVSAVRSDKCPFLDDKGKIAFQQVIVTIGTSGAVIIDSDTDTLIFDQSGQEGDFNRKLQGQMIGYNTCVLGALASDWTESRDKVNWVEAAKMGIGLSRLLHLEGYETVEEDKNYYLQFPATKLVDAYRRKRDGQNNSTEKSNVWDLGVFTDKRALARDPKVTADWSILEESVRIGAGGCHLGSATGPDAVLDCARKIVEEGPQAALLNIPVETVSKWRSADRKEIEGVRSVNNAIQDYLKLKNPSTPLCVAVFGPPGSGKSFAIKQIASGLGIGKEAQLTFNLSQFESPDELSTAFQQIRDLHLKGQMPLVFWDEFDSSCQGNELGWLRYFLAPMQDGEFTEKGSIHPVGGGIYVFAGATFFSFEKFCEGNTDKDRKVKKPDFISRLKAYIDVLGPNGNPDKDKDSLYIIRRAFLLNTYLETNAPHIKKGNKFQLERGILEAFLRVDEYKHGARSMETMVKMSNLFEKRKFELSSLPPDHIIKMHVDAEEFNKLTRL